jgi:propionyl-CoA carboxylase alpha chain
MGDKHGNVIHLFERECSIQRRNQKVIEEAPSPLLDKKTREAMGAQAVALAQAVGYDSAGTVEFVASGADKSFYFLEMNTRLQVEHPVTEMITGVDLVELMIRVAAGQKLPIAQKDLKISGWAIESRIYAEDPYRNFLPSIGRLKRYQPPDEGQFGTVTVRNDAGARAGDEISMFYDPMISKLVTHAPSRLEAIDAQAHALDRFLIDGIQDNIPFLGAVMEEETFRSGSFTTAYIKQQFPEGFKGVVPRDDQARLLAACAGYAQSVQAARARKISGAVNGGGARTEWAVILDGHTQQVTVKPGDDGAVVTVNSSKPASLASPWRPGQPVMEGSFDGKPFAVKIAARTEGYRLRLRGVSVNAIVTTPRGAALHKLIPEKVPADTSKTIMSPMPGLVVSIDVKPGQEVKAGEGVAVVEAMKMQNIIRAERDGVVAKVHVAAGASVAADEVLVELG